MESLTMTGRHANAAWRRLPGRLCACGLVLAWLSTAQAQAQDPDEPPPPAAPTAMPTDPPPPPPSEIPEPPPPDNPDDANYQTEPGEAPPPSAAENEAPQPEGQWAYTNQYGWVWMPYGESYTSVPDQGYPSAFLYYPRFGWRWVVAPWVFGWGPQPRWGVRGRGHFAWYAHPWFAHREYRANPRQRGASQRAPGGRSGGGHGGGGRHR